MTSRKPTALEEIALVARQHGWLPAGDHDKRLGAFLWTRGAYTYTYVNVNVRGAIMNAQCDRGPFIGKGKREQVLSYVAKRQYTQPSPW